MECGKRTRTLLHRHSPEMLPMALPCGTDRQAIILDLPDPTPGAAPDPGTGSCQQQLASARADMTHVHII